MIIPNDPDKFLSSWKYLETAKYVQSLGRVIRQKDGDNTLFIEAKDKEFFRQQNGILASILLSGIIIPLI